MGKYIQAAVGVVVGLLVLVLVLAFGPRVKRALVAEPLQPEVWARDLDARDPMVDDVIDWLERDRPTKDAVLSRLGRPERDRDASQWRGNFSYALDSGATGLDPYTLEIWFENDRVSKAKRIQH